MGKRSAIEQAGAAVDYTRRLLEAMGPITVVDGLVRAGGIPIFGRTEVVLAAAGRRRCADRRGLSAGGNKSGGNPPISKGALT